MTDQELIELARAYVALSNAHHLELILAMFEEESIYTSSAVGQFKGCQFKVCLSPLCKQHRSSYGGTLAGWRRYDFVGGD